MESCVSFKTDAAHSGGGIDNHYNRLGRIDEASCRNMSDVMHPARIWFLRRGFEEPRLDFKPGSWIGGSGAGFETAELDVSLMRLGFVAPGWI